jgi:hypothetical protein
MFRGCGGLCAVNGRHKGAMAYSAVERLPTLTSERRRRQILEGQGRYYAKNKDKISLFQKRYRDNNKEKLVAYRATYFQKACPSSLPFSLLLSSCLLSANYLLRFCQNKGKYIEYGKRNKEKDPDYFTRYHLAHQKKILEQKKLYRAKKKKSLLKELANDAHLLRVHP